MRSHCALFPLIPTTSYSDNMEKAPGVLLSSIAVYLELYEIIRLERVSRVFLSELSTAPRILDRVLKDRLVFPDCLLPCDVTEESIKAICMELATGPLKTLGFFIYDASVIDLPSTRPLKSLSETSILKIANFDQVNSPSQPHGRLFPLLLDFSVTSLRVTHSPHTLMVFSSPVQHDPADLISYTGLFRTAWNHTQLHEICHRVDLLYTQSEDTEIELMLFHSQNMTLRPLFWVHFENMSSNVKVHLPEPVLAAHVYMLILQAPNCNFPQDWISILRPSGKLVHIC